MEKKIVIDLCNPKKMNLCPKALSGDMKNLVRFAPSCMEVWDNCPKPKLTRYLAIVGHFQPCTSCNKIISKLPLQCQIKARSETPCHLGGRSNPIRRKLSYVFIFGGSLTIILPCSECPTGNESKYESISMEIHNDYPILRELDDEDFTFLNEILSNMFDESLKFFIKSSKLQAGINYLENGVVQPVRLQETITAIDDYSEEGLHIRSRQTMERAERPVGELAQPYERKEQVS